MINFDNGSWNNHDKKYSTVILGGGSAGWLTALFLKRNWKNLEITVIEDPNKLPIIAGESGSTTFTDLLIHLNIDKSDFIKHTNATPKLGGRFIDWNGIDTEFLHVMQTDFTPWLDEWGRFISDQSNLTLSSFNRIFSQEHEKNLFLKTVLANDVPLSEMFLAGEFIRQDKVPFGAPLELPCIPMWHFESRAAAAYFKNIGIERGIKIVEGTYQTAFLKQNGDIESLSLVDGKTIYGDWFIDCTGFSRLLLEGVIGEKIVDYSHYFPARAVVAWWDDPCPSLLTTATAMRYGWSWNINLRHRSGNGYLYDPDHIDLDQAVAEAESRFDKKITPIANFKFTPGIVENSWRNNVIAVGLSSGFLEPLEANGVAVIIETLYALQDLWRPEVRDHEQNRKRFNQRTFAITQDIKDFLALHYRGHRNDTDFWLQHQHSDRTPESLKNKLDDWAEYYRSFKPEPRYYGYSSAAWLTVLQGLRLFSSDELKRLPKINIGIADKIIQNVRNRHSPIVDSCWKLEEWLRRMT